MEPKSNILPILKQKAGTIILAGILLGALSFLFLVINEKNFKVTTDYLIVQDQSQGQDYYTLSKSAEFLGNVLGQSIYSELFIDEAIKTGKIDGNFLPSDPKKRLDEWNKIVQVKQDPQLGMIHVSILNNNQSKALNISNAISDVLTAKNYLFRGNGQNIDVRILSGPIIEKNPTMRNILFSIIGGFLMGALLSLLGFFLFGKNHKSQEDYEKEYLEKLKYLKN
jgi:capsular polysaccharide biosynthesis protein